MADSGIVAESSEDVVMDTSHDHRTSGSRSAQRIARTIVAERVRSIVARNRTRRRRLLSSSSEVRLLLVTSVPDRRFFDSGA